MKYDNVTLNLSNYTWKCLVLKGVICLCHPVQNTTDAIYVCETLSDQTEVDQHQLCDFHKHKIIKSRQNCGSSRNMQHNKHNRLEKIQTNKFHFHTFEKTINRKQLHRM